MWTIAVASRKGGSGKSTIAAHLGVLADRADAPALLIDADPQGSLRFWYELREQPTPLLVACDAHDIPQTLDAARRDGIEWCIIDGPPHAGEAIAAMMRAADLVIIPSRPAAFDLAAVGATIEMARELWRPYVVALNAVPPNRELAENPITAEARKALRALRAPTWGGALGARAAFAHALAGGLSVGEFDPQCRAAREMERLWRDARRLLTEESDLMRSTGEPELMGQ